MRLDEVEQDHEQSLAPASNIHQNQIYADDQNVSGLNTPIEESENENEMDDEDSRDNRGEEQNNMIQIGSHLPQERE